MSSGKTEMLEVLLSSLPSKLTQKGFVPLKSARLLTFCNKLKARLIPSELNVSRENKFRTRFGLDILGNRDEQGT